MSVCSSTVRITVCSFPFSPRFSRGHRVRECTPMHVLSKCRRVCMLDLQSSLLWETGDPLGWGVVQAWAQLAIHTRCCLDRALQCACSKMCTWRHRVEPCTSKTDDLESDCVTFLSESFLHWLHAVISEFPYGSCKTSCDNPSDDWICSVSWL